MANSRNPLDHMVAKFDQFQRVHAGVALMVGLVRKIGDDEAGQRAALLTYYGFLALFPLLLVLTSLLKFFTRSNQAVTNRIVTGITSYMPVIGVQLQQNVHGLGTTGLAFVVGLVLALYGARGVADVLRSSIDRIWEVPHKDRRGFADGLLRSVGIMIVGGIGLIIAPILAGFIFVFGHAVLFRVLFILLMTLCLFMIMLAVIKLASSRPRPLSTIWVGSALAAIGLEVMQLVGGLIVTRQLKHLDSLYGTFAIVLGLFYWIYLQAQIVTYSFELDSVRAFKLWPRSLQGSLTDADREAARLYAERSQFQR